MSSSRSWPKRASPEAISAIAAAPGRWLNRKLNAWLKRRGPVHPPLTLAYRQIFILPTRFGWMLGLIAFAMLMGSLNFNNNLGLFTTFLVAGIALLSMHIAYRNLQGISIRGCNAEPVFAGNDLKLTVQLSDTSLRLRSGLRLTGPDNNMHADVSDLRPDQDAQLSIALPTTQRGWLKVGRLRLSTRHPLGLFEAWSVFWPEHSFLIWPQPADQAPPLPISPRQRDSEQPGDEGDEFHGLRDWREGDPIHRIAWKASQRHQDLLARQFSRPAQDELVLNLEQAPGLTREQRISVVTRWLLDADRSGARFGLDLGSVRIAPDIGPKHRTRCLNALAELP